MGFYILLYAVLAGVGWLVKRCFHAPMLTPGRDIREGEPLLSRVANAAVGFLSPVGNPHDNLSTIFARGRSMPRQVGSAIEFRATSGWRYGFIGCAIFLLVFCINLELTTELSGQTPMDMYLLIVGIMAYGIAYVWRFRLAVDGVDLSVMNGLFMTRHFELTELTGVRRTREGYKMYFADRRSISVPFFVEGHDMLRDFLIGQLEDNGV